MQHHCFQDTLGIRGTFFRIMDKKNGLIFRSLKFNENISI